MSCEPPSPDMAKIPGPRRPTRTPMRRCGKRYDSEEEAFRSKAGQIPGVEVNECRCNGYHIVKPSPVTADLSPRKPVVSGNTIPPKVCRQVDKRDGKQCVKCGSRRDVHRHHRRLQGHGGDPRPHTDCACNLVSLCSVCHFWAHVAGRLEAEAEGLIIPRETREPGRIGVMVHTEADSGSTRWPRCDGTYGDYEPDEVAA